MLASRRIAERCRTTTDQLEHSRGSERYQEDELCDGVFIAPTGMCQGQHIEHRHLSFVLVQKWRLAEQLEELATRTANLPSGIWRAMKPQSDDGHALPGMLAPMKRLPSPTYRLLGVNIPLNLA